MSTYLTGGLYVTSASQTIQKSYANKSTPVRESRRGVGSPLSTLDSLSASGLSVYAQQELRSMPRAGGSSARQGDAEFGPRMTTAYTTADRRESGERHRHNERVCVRQGRGNFRGLGGTFDGRSKTPESKNRKTAVRLSGLSGLSGVLTPPSLKTEGGEGGHARMGRKQTNCGGGSSE